MPTITDKCYLPSACAGNIHLSARSYFNPLLHRYLTHRQQTAFENIVGKEEIARNKQFLLFQQCFLFNQKIVSPVVNIYHILSLFAAELEEPKIGKRGEGLT